MIYPRADLQSSASFAEMVQSDLHTRISAWWSRWTINSGARYMIVWSFSLILVKIGSYSNPYAAFSASAKQKQSSQFYLRRKVLLFVFFVVFCRLLLPHWSTKPYESSPQFASILLSSLFVKLIGCKDSTFSNAYATALFNIASLKNTLVWVRFTGKPVSYRLLLTLCYHFDTPKSLTR